MSKRFTLLSCLALAAMSVSAETVTLFDAEALGCDANRLYMGPGEGDSNNGWGGTVFTLPEDNDKMSSSDKSFVDHAKVLKIYNDALKSGDKDAVFHFTFGWADGAEFQFALGDNSDKSNNIIDYTGVSNGSSMDVRLSDFTGDKWNQTTSMSAEDAAAKLKAAGYITIDGHHYDIVKITYEYTPGEGEDPRPVGESGTVNITNIAQSLGLNGDWSHMPDDPDSKYENFKDGVVWIKPAYLPNVQVGDCVQITLGD